MEFDIKTTGNKVKVQDIPVMGMFMDKDGMIALRLQHYGGDLKGVLALALNRAGGTPHTEKFDEMVTPVKIDGKIKVVICVDGQ